MKRLIIVLSLLFSFNGWAEDVTKKNANKKLVNDAFLSLLEKSKQCNLIASSFQAMQIYKLKGIPLKEALARVRAGDSEKSLYEKAYDMDISDPVRLGSGAFNICMKPVYESIDNV